MPDWGREAGLFETPLASATPAQAMARPARLEAGWIVLSDCRIDGGDGPPDIVLLHPAIGVALLEMEPRWTADAETRFRQRLDAIGFLRHYPGHLPVIHRRLRPSDLPELPTLLTEAFSWQPALSLPEGGAWVAAARRALTERAAPTPSRPAAAAPSVRPGLTRGRKLTMGVAGAVAAGIAVLIALPDPPDLVPQGAPPAAAAAPAGTSQAAPPPTQLALVGPMALPSSALVSPALPPPSAAVAAAAPPPAVMQPDIGLPRLDEPPAVLAVADPPLLLAQRAAAPPPAPAVALPEPPLPALELPPDVAALAAVATPPPPAPPPPLAAVEAPPALVQVDFVAPPPPPPPAPPLAPLDAPPVLAVLPFVPPPPLPPAPLAPLDAPPVLAELAFVAPPPPPPAALPPLDLPPSVIELAFVPPPAPPPPPVPAAVAPVRAAPAPPPMPPAPAPAAAAAARAAQATQNPAMLTALLRRGEQLLAIGDVSGARRFFERAANGGSAQAALAMGGTFDPAGLAAIGARGIPADRAAALSWYRRAAALGEADAAPRIAALEARP